jgi:hypothetical protein
MPRRTKSSLIPWTPTIHADTPYAALNNRLTALLMRSEGGFSEDIARLTVAQTIQVVIQISRVHGRRFISEIAVVDGAYLDERGLVAGQPIFQSKLRLVKDEQGAHAEIEHRRVASVKADTVLAAKLADAGEEVERWVED